MHDERLDASQARVPQDAEDDTVDWWPSATVGVVDEYDTPAEVDAVFRTQRRIAFSYLVLFLTIVLVVPLLTVTVDWWSSGRLIGAMSPNFAMAAIGLYVIFALIGLGASTLANAVEDRMLGAGGAGENDVEDAP